MAQLKKQNKISETDLKGTDVYELPDQNTFQYNIIKMVSKVKKVLCEQN